MSPTAPSKAKRTVTIRDVARQAGVSVGTVSRILNGGNKEAWTSTAKRSEEIRNLARKMGYVPNRQAIRLSRQRSNCVGLLYARDALYRGDMYHRFIASATERLTLAGFDLMMIPTLGEFEDWSQKLADARVDGCLIMPPLPLGLEKLLDQRQLPVVMVNIESDLAVPHVLYDEQQGVTAAVQHLCSLGHQRLAWFHRRDKQGDWERETDHHSLAQRRSAFLATGSADDRVAIEAPAEAFVDQLLANPASSPTAVLAYTDRDAIELMRAAHERGVSLPRDLSIVGYDNSMYAQYAIPSLTTVDVPVVEAGRNAVEALLAGIEHTAKASPAKHRLGQQLIVRHSTTAPPSPSERFTSHA